MPNYRSFVSNITQHFDHKSQEYVEEYIRQHPVEQRNQYRDDVAVVVVGPQTHLDVLVSFYTGLKNVVFVVESTDSKQVVNTLEDSGIAHVLSEPPKVSGYGNVNRQCRNSLTGVSAAKRLFGAKYVLRMRSDQLVVQLAEFINAMDFTRPGFITSTFNTPQHQPGDNFTGWNKLYLTDSARSTDDLTTDYVLDFCISGSAADLEMMFDYYEETPLQAPAEHKIYMNYVHKAGLPYRNDLRFLREHFTFMLDVCHRRGIDFLMLKQQYNNWTVAMMLQPWLYANEEMALLYGTDL